MVVVHIAAIPSEKEQRCVRCCQKLIEIDPVTRSSYRPLTFLAQHNDGYLEIQETDATLVEQIACKQRGRHS